MSNARRREPAAVPARWDYGRNAQRWQARWMRYAWGFTVALCVAGCALGGRERSAHPGEQAPPARQSTAAEDFVGPPAPPRVEAEGPPEIEGPPAPTAHRSAAPAARAETAPSAAAGPSAASLPGMEAESDDAMPVRQARATDPDAALMAKLVRLGVDVHPSARGPVVVLPDTIFEFGTSTLQRDARKKIHEVGRIVSERAVPARVAVEGHTDSIGAELYNRGLSERRAHAVAVELHSAGIAEKFLTSKGLGSQFPIAPNERADGSDDPQGRSRNRRVEIVIETGDRPPA